MFFCTACLYAPFLHSIAFRKPVEHFARGLSYAQLLLQSGGPGRYYAHARHLDP
jgi:hypothetical protein